MDDIDLKDAERFFKKASQAFAENKRLKKRLEEMSAQVIQLQNLASSLERPITGDLLIFEPPKKNHITMVEMQKHLHPRIIRGLESIGVQFLTDLLYLQEGFLIQRIDNFGRCALNKLDEYCRQNGIIIGHLYTQKEDIFKIIGWSHDGTVAKYLEAVRPSENSYNDETVLNCWKKVQEADMGGETVHVVLSRQDYDLIGKALDIYERQKNG